MKELNESLGNQTQNGSNENNQFPADNTTGTMFNETNSTMEQNLNPSEDAQQQGANVAAPEADSTEQAVETASDSSDLVSSEGNEAPVKELVAPVLPASTKERQEEFTKAITEEAMMEKLKAEGYIDENGNPTERLNEKLKKLKKLSDRGCREPMVKYLYLASELKAAGYKFCFDKENREINNNHVDELLDRIKDDKSKRFMETLKVCEVRLALEQGRKVFDVDGNEITLDTPDLEKYVLILDGQHRWIVILENPDYDIWVDFVETEDVGAYIDNLNNSSKKWDGDDVKHSLRMHYSGKVPVLDVINEFKVYFGVSEKYAEIMLTRKKEQFRLNVMKQIQAGTKVFDADKFKVDDQFIDTGWDIMYAIIHQFDKERKVRKIEFIESLYNVYEELLDDEKDSFDMNIKIFLTTMDGIVKDEILQRISSKNTQPLNSYVRKQYDTMLKEQSEKLAELGIKATEIIARKKAEIENTDGKVSRRFKRLKSGSPAEILKNREAERVEAKIKEEAKPQKSRGTTPKVTSTAKATKATKATNTSKANEKK